MIIHLLAPLSLYSFLISNCITILKKIKTIIVLTLKDIRALNYFLGIGS